MRLASFAVMVALSCALGVPNIARADLATDAREYGERFAAQVDKRFQVQPTEDEMRLYKQKLLARPELAALERPEFVVVVNRNPKSQRLAIFLVEQGRGEYIGAARVSTGTSGRKGYFFTPLGLFENRRENGNYRAVGTKNEHGLRGLGPKGSRVFDFGWQASTAGWGAQAPAQIRLQMHGTDPDHLEPRLGSPASKGCVRIHQDVNRFIDENGVMDRHYAENGSWVLSKNKKSSPLRRALHAGGRRPAGRALTNPEAKGIISQPSQDQARSPYE